MKNLIVVAFLIVCAPPLTNAQITGIFGGDAVASGFQHQGNTTNMWLKFGEITLNGAYNRGTLMIDFFPDESPHGDSRQTIIVNLRNNSTGYNFSVSDIVLITQYGDNLTVKDLRVVHTAGTGISNNKFSVWVQMGSSWIAYVPIEVRVAGSVTYATTHQIYGASITDVGTVYEPTSRYGMTGSTFEVEGTIRSKEVKVEASPWPDYVFADNYELPSLEEIEKFIKEEKHLPEVPSSAEVQENGIALGEMNALLLKKIEELTLYTIAQEAKIKRLEEAKDQELNAKSLEEKIEELTLHMIEMNKNRKEATEELLTRIKELENK